MFSRFGFLGLSPFPQYKKMAGRKEVLFKREGDCGNNACFAELDKSYYLEGMNKLERRWAKCVSLKGDYTEKIYSWKITE